MNENRVLPSTIQNMVGELEYKCHIVEGSTTTLAVAFYRGFQLAVGKSACVDPANFNKADGEKYAIAQAEALAKDKLWEFMGWSLWMKNHEEQAVKSDDALIYDRFTQAIKG